MEEEEENSEAILSASRMSLIACINDMNKEQLIAYLEENLGDEVDPEHIRERLSDEEVEEYKKLLINALIPQQEEGGEDAEEEEGQQQEQKEEKSRHRHKDSEKKRSSDKKKKNHSREETKVKESTSHKHKKSTDKKSQARKETKVEESDRLDREKSDAHWTKKTTADDRLDKEKSKQSKKEVVEEVSDKEKSDTLPTKKEVVEVVLDEEKSDTLPTKKEVSDKEKSDTLPTSKEVVEEVSDKEKSDTLPTKIKKEVNDDEIKILRDNRVKIGNTVFVHPDFHRYKKKFKLKSCKVVLYDIKKQNYHWTKGDKVYRTQLRDERRRHGKSDHKHGHSSGNVVNMKFNERGCRVLEFEKRPESDRHKKYREIVREKPKTEPEKPNLFEVLHKTKEKEREERRQEKKLKMEFRIPIKKSEQFKERERYQEPVTTTTPSRQNKLKFDTRPLVTSTQKNDTWQMTPQEKNALKKQERQLEEVPEPVVDDGGYFADAFDVDDNDEIPNEVKEDTASGAGADSTGAPLNEISSDLNDVALNVIRLVETGKDVSPPRENATPAELVEKKIATWELKNQKEPYYQTVADIPENEEEEFYTLISAVEVDEDEESFYGNVSHPSGKGSDFVQDNEVSSSLDPDKADEYCGAGLLTAKFRVGGKGIAGDTEDCFKSVFEVRRGCNYEKQHFQAKCNLCNGEFINGKRHLGAHVRSSRHRQNLAELSLTLIGMDAKLASSKEKGAAKSSHKSSEKSSSHGSKTRGDKSDTREKEKDKDRKDKDRKEKEQDKIKETKDRNGHKSSAKDDKHSTKHDSAGKAGSGSSHTTLPPTSPNVRAVVEPTHIARKRSHSPRGRRRSRSRSPIYVQRSSGGGHHKRGRSRSPRQHRSRSRSPRCSRNRRTSSRDRVEAFLARNERSSRRSRSPPAKIIPSAKPPRTKQDENMIFHEKLTLQANGKWTAELEGRWKSMEDDEEQLKRLHTLKKRLMEEKPEEHPLYATEWEKFWERRYRELIDQGKSTEFADGYDYTTEWKEEWGKLTQQILLSEYDTRLHEIRIKYGMDLDTLRTLNATRAPPAPIPSYIPTGFPPAPPNFGMIPLAVSRDDYINPPPPGISLDDFSNPPPPGVSRSDFSNPPPPGVSRSDFSNPPPPGVSHGEYLSRPFPTGVPPPVPMPVMTTSVNPHQGFGGVVQTGVYSTTAPIRQTLNTLLTPTSHNEPIIESEVTLVQSNVGGVDYTAKSMSISDDGSVRSSSTKDSNPAPKVTVDDIKSTWLNLTGQKISAAVVKAASKSGPGSQSGGSGSGVSREYDYDGFDVVQVLRLMCGLDDELSFLAPKVQESYRLAEDMELNESRSSFTMLKDKEFVTLLFQCRDKFNSILRANVSSSEVMRKLNLTVYGMNALLDSPNCQKLRPPAATSISLSMETKESRTPAPPVMESNIGDLESRSQELTRKREVESRGENPIAAALAHLPMSTKIAISSVVASSLIVQGKDRLSDSELLTNLLKIFAPIIGRGVVGNIPTTSTIDVTYNQNLFERSMPITEENQRPSRSVPSSTPLPPKGDGFGNSYDTFDRHRGIPQGRPSNNRSHGQMTEPLMTESVMSSKTPTSYSAIPPLPEFHARAASPPAHKKFAMQQQQPPQQTPMFVPNPLANPRPGGGVGRRPSSPYDSPYDGRRPPAPLDQDLSHSQNRSSVAHRRVETKVKNESTDVSSNAKVVDESIAVNISPLLEVQENVGTDRLQESILLSTNSGDGPHEELEKEIQQVSTESIKLPTTRPNETIIQQQPQEPSILDALIAIAEQADQVLTSQGGNIHPRSIETITQQQPLLSTLLQSIPIISDHRSQDVLPTIGSSAKNKGQGGRRKVKGRSPSPSLSHSQSWITSDDEPYDPWETELAPDVNVSSIVPDDRTFDRLQTESTVRSSSPGEKGQEVHGEEVIDLTAQDDVSHEQQQPKLPLGILHMIEKEKNRQGTGVGHSSNRNQQSLNVHRGRLTSSALAHKLSSSRSLKPSRSDTVGLCIDHKRQQRKHKDDRGKTRTRRKRKKEVPHEEEEKRKRKRRKRSKSSTKKHKKKKRDSSSRRSGSPVERRRSSHDYKGRRSRSPESGSEYSRKQRRFSPSGSSSVISSKVMTTGKRHHRSRKVKRIAPKEDELVPIPPTDSTVAGVSKAFWDTDRKYKGTSSCFSSEGNFPTRTERSPPRQQQRTKPKFQPKYRQTGREAGEKSPEKFSVRRMSQLIDAEEGELISSSDTDFSNLEPPPAPQPPSSMGSDISENWDLGIVK